MGRVVLPSAFRKKIEGLRVEVRALKIALGDDRVPSHAKGVILLAVGYAVSPLDLLPDALPGVGQIDDAILVPLLLTVAWRTVPGEVRRDIKERAEREVEEAPPLGVSVLGALVWLVVALGYAATALLADRD